MHVLCSSSVFMKSGEASSCVCFPVQSWHVSLVHHHVCGVRQYKEISVKTCANSISPTPTPSIKLIYTDTHMTAFYKRKTTCMVHWIFNVGRFVLVWKILIGENGNYLIYHMQCNLLSLEVTAVTVTVSVFITFERVLLQCCALWMLLMQRAVDISTFRPVAYPAMSLWSCWMSLRLIWSQSQGVS